MSDLTAIRFNVSKAPLADLDKSHLLAFQGSVGHQITVAGLTEALEGSLQSGLDDILATVEGKLAEGSEKLLRALDEHQASRRELAELSAAVDAKLSQIDAVIKSHGKAIEKAEAAMKLAVQAKSTAEASAGDAHSRQKLFEEATASNLERREKAAEDFEASISGSVSELQVELKSLRGEVLRQGKGLNDLKSAFQLAAGLRKALEATE